jgi:hypothetical protein
VKFLITALIALNLICPGRAAAQAQSDPEAVAAAKELIITLRMTDQFTLSLPGMLQVIKPLVTQGRPEIDRDFDAAAPVVLDEMKALVTEFLGPIADIYARNFTVNEMREMTTFYRKPTGQKFLDKSPVVTQETATIAQNIGNALAREMHVRMVEELRKRGQKTVILK